MTLLEVFRAIDSIRYPKRIAELLYRIADAYLKPQTFDLPTRLKIRRRLSSLENKFNPSIKGLSEDQKQRITLITAAKIVFLKLYPMPEMDAKNFYHGKKHIVSDHALVSAMGRLGYDVEKIKEFFLQQALKEGLTPIMSPERNVIITFLNERVDVSSPFLHHKPLIGSRKDTL